MDRGKEGGISCTFGQGMSIIYTWIPPHTHTPYNLHKDFYTFVHKVGLPIFVDILPAILETSVHN